jgi:hypothetical protein
LNCGINNFSSVEGMHSCEICPSGFSSTFEGSRHCVSSFILLFIKSNTALD